VPTIAIADNPSEQSSRLVQPLYNEWEKGGSRLEFHTFDAAYVRCLADGDPATEAHFSGYFRKFIVLKLSARRLSASMAEDIQQETLLRVLKALRVGSGVSQPERFGAFVNSVCNHVLLEFLHKESRQPVGLENSPEPADDRIDMDASLVTDERKKAVADILDGLASKDREILRLVFFEEAGRDEICLKLGVRTDYLRVLLHRAKEKFAQSYLQKRRSTSGAAGTSFCL
jgi:RNA polymerase sigma-70 factor (ECF subfamily)